MTAVAPSPVSTSLLEAHVSQSSQLYNGLSIGMAQNPRFPVSEGLPPAYISKKLVQITLDSGAIHVVSYITFFNIEEITSKKPTKLQELIDAGRIVCVRIKDHKIDTLFFSQAQADFATINGVTTFALRGHESIVLITQQYKSTIFSERSYKNYTARILKDLPKV